MYKLYTLCELFNLHEWGLRLINSRNDKIRPV